MKNFKKISLALLAATSFAGAANATVDETFNATLNLLSPITLDTVRDLDFEATLANQNVDVTTVSADPKAAVFSAKGSANWQVTGTVVENSIEMITGDGSDQTKRITVDSFTYGGDMDSAGLAVFDGSGNLNDLRVGATAHVQSDDIAGRYVGQATFRLTYM